jgi:transposase InsO family protein
MVASRRARFRFARLDHCSSTTPTRLNFRVARKCLDAHWFGDLAEACQRIEAWKVEYNASRPHRALGERTPNEFAREIAASRDLSGLQTAGN